MCLLSCFNKVVIIFAGASHLYLYVASGPGCSRAGAPSRFLRSGHPFPSRYRPQLHPEAPSHGRRRGPWRYPLPSFLLKGCHIHKDSRRPSGLDHLKKVRLNFFQASIASHSIVWNNQFLKKKLWENTSILLQIRRQIGWRVHRLLRWYLGR